MSGKARKAKRIANKLNAKERIQQMQHTIDQLRHTINQLRAYVIELERWHQEDSIYASNGSGHRVNASL